MTDYTALANALKAKLEADAYMIANSVTVEKWTRGLEVQDDDGTLRCSDSDLPLLVIQIPSGGKSSEHYPREIRSSVPGQVTAVTTAATLQAGVDDHMELIAALEDELESLKTSLNNLGANTLVQDVSSTVNTQKRGESVYFITRTSFLIDTTNTY